MKRLLPFFILSILSVTHERSAAQFPEASAQHRVADLGDRAVDPAAQAEIDAQSSPVTVTAAQAQKGRAIYDLHCVSCHGPSLGDGMARPLTGRDFKARWFGHSAAGLRDYIRRQMPPGLAGTLSNDEYTELVALLLKANGIVPGNAPLPSDDQALAEMRMQFPGALVAAGGLALDVKLPPWPQAPDPAKALTPVTDEMLKNPAPGDWLTWRRTLDGLGFSPLTQITAANVSKLTLVWTYPLAPGPNEATPLVHDGVIFIASAGNNLDALNARTGELLWSYRPEVGDGLPGGSGGPSIRNMALYGQNLYLRLGTHPDTIGALDARTGKLVWQAQLEASASGGPLVVNGKVFQGLGRAPSGSMKAMDAKTGAPLWRWSAIPKDREPGGNTWGDIPDERRSGAALWTTSYYDYDLNLVVFGTGNTYDTAWLATPALTLTAHDALYTDSTVALNPETGKLVWYFQDQAGDPFDLDYAFERMIVPLSINGKTTKSVLTMGKPGVLDAMEAATGKYLFSLDSGVQNFITHIDPLTGRKSIDQKLIPSPGDQTAHTVCPDWLGAKNWPPGAADPHRKVVYMALNESCMVMTPVYPGDATALSSGFMPHESPMPGSDGRVGRLQAFDVQNRKVLWLKRQRAPMTTGVLATSGGVVFAGSLDRTFAAFSEQTGQQLWSTRLGDVPSSAPISYSVNGRQYVAMVVGFGSSHSTGFLPLVPEIPTPARASSAIYVFALP